MVTLGLVEDGDRQEVDLVMS